MSARSSPLTLDHDRATIAHMSEPPVNNLPSVAEAIAILDATSVQPRIVLLPLDAALGFRLAADLTADRDDPPFDKSQMDGFAIRVADAARLRVVSEIMAGSVGRPIQAGEAAAIMTGAPVPDGADAVVPIEQTARDGEFVLLNRTPKPGQSIARRASDMRRGEIVLKKGTILGPAQIGVAASVGASSVSVFARPKVAVLSTGDELVEIEQSPAGAQIRNSNSHMLVAVITRLGCEVTDLGIVPDKPNQIGAAIGWGMQFDALFITGGMSMGERDFVPSLLAEIGLELKIAKVRIKPGKPFVFAACNDGPGAGRFVFGLPGNPVSAFVCTLRFASRILHRMAGGKIEEPTFPAKLTAALPANGSREFNQPALLDREGNVTPLNWKSSADIYTLAAANALLIRPENAPAAVAGELVLVIKIP